MESCWRCRNIQTCTVVFYVQIRDVTAIHKYTTSLNGGIWSFYLQLIWMDLSQFYISFWHIILYIFSPDTGNQPMHKVKSTWMRSNSSLLLLLPFLNIFLAERSLLSISFSLYQCRQIFFGMINAQKAKCMLVTLFT